MLPCRTGRRRHEVREEDERIAAICEAAHHFNTRQCVTAERAFLAAMGGGCQSPVAAYAEVVAASSACAPFPMPRPVRRAQAKRPLKEAVELGQQLAAELKA